jgi:hypothetical protein
MGARFVFKSIVCIVISLAVLVASLCLYVKWQARRTSKNAEILLAELRKMEVGETRLDQVQRLAGGSQSRFLVKGIDPSCQGEYCTYAFGYYTAILGKLTIWRLYLWRLYLIPAPVNFNVFLIVKRDRLVRIGMSLSSDVIPRTVLASVTDEVPEISPVHESYSYGKRLSEISVYIKPSATTAQRNAAYSLNLNCMNRIGGCLDASMLLGVAPN